MSEPTSGVGAASATDASTGAGTETSSSRRFPQPESGDGPAILVVDDDEDIRETLRLVLSEQGYTIATANHGDEALAQLREGALPDLIILDLLMPVRSGWHVWDELQLVPRLAEIPVFIYTATGLGQGSVGSATVLAKDASMDELVARVGEAVKPRRPS